MAIDVSLIIVNLNARQLLEACLDSVYGQTRDVAFEVIVVDNHSSDGSVEMVKTKFPQVHLIENSVNNRYAIANNQGLAVAQGTYVLYLNSDILLQGNTVRELYEFLEAHKEAGGVGGQLIYPDGRHQDSCFRFPSAVNLWYLSCFARFYWKTRLAGNYPVTSLNTTRPVDFVVGACFMARRDLLVRCSGMDTEFYLYGEDSDLCYRMQQVRGNTYYLPEATPVIHYGGASTLQLFDNDHRVTHLWGWKARFLFVKKHYPFWRRLLVLLGIFAGLGINIILYCLAFLKRRNWKYTKNHLHIKWDITKEAFKILLFPA